MPDISNQHITYSTDSFSFAKRLQDLPGFVWLESGGQQRPGVDVISACPGLELSLEGGRLVQRPCTPEACDSIAHALPADAVIEVLAANPDSDWIGYLTYDAAEESLKRQPVTRQPKPTPALQLARYDWALILDHAAGTASLKWYEGCSKTTREQILARLFGRSVDNAAPSEPTDFRLQGPFRSDQTRDQYCSSFQRIQDYIRAGDCYQVNYAQRFSTRYQGDPWHAYLALRRITKAPYGAFLRTPVGAVLSFSPEQFLHIEGRHIRTAPIKGTRPRGPTAADDLLLRQELAASTKDRAENLMIVDLLRNDLGRHSETGSVKVEHLFEIQTYRNVHHLVSTISATLNAGTHPLRLFFDAFPGGSITGAPKRRAMEIIAELEPHRRSVYCGSIFWWSAEHVLRSNIAIRTLVCEQGNLYCWGGGGIVADSEEEQEYQESINKVALFMQALEQAFL